MIRIFFLILLLVPGKVYAQDAGGFADLAIAGPVKILAKVFVQTADLNKIKTRQINVLSKMQEAKFQKRYTEVYKILRDVPPEVLAQYGLKEHMTKQEAIKDIRHLNKKELMETINKIPDRVVVKCVKDCLKHKAVQWKNLIQIGEKSQKKWEAGHSN